MLMMERTQAADTDLRIERGRVQARQQPRGAAHGHRARRRQQQQTLHARTGGCVGGPPPVVTKTLPVAWRDGGGGGGRVGVRGVRQGVQV